MKLDTIKKVMEFKDIMRDPTLKGAYTLVNAIDSAARGPAKNPPWALYTYEHLAKEVENPVRVEELVEVLENYGLTLRRYLKKWLEQHEAHFERCKGCAHFMETNRFGDLVCAKKYECLSDGFLCYKEDLEKRKMNCGL
jgi:hypothetical protein